MALELNLELVKMLSGRRPKRVSIWRGQVILSGFLGGVTTLMIPMTRTVRPILPTVHKPWPS